MNVHRIPTKLGIEIRLNEPFKCAKFQPIGARIRVLWRILQSVQKEEVEEEKNEEKNPNFGRSYLGNGWSNFLQIWNVDSPT